MQAHMDTAPRHRSRLTRSMRDASWFGVASGMAHYLGIEVSLMRTIWVVAAIFSGGVALLVYLAAAVVMPRDDQATTVEPDVSPGEYALRRRRFWGTVLLAIGATILLVNLTPWQWLEWRIVWPLLLLVLGVALLVDRLDWRR